MINWIISLLTPRYHVGAVTGRIVRWWWAPLWMDWEGCYTGLKSKRLAIELSRKVIETRKAAR